MKEVVMIEAVYALIGTGGSLAAIWWVHRADDRRRAHEMDFEAAADEAIALTRIPQARRPAASEESLTQAGR